MHLLDETYVVFDLETTGFKPTEGCSIIEIGAVKVKNGEVIDRFDLLVDPEINLPKEIIEVTSITDDMLKGCIKEEEAVKKFLEWAGDNIFVAHNANFDMSFIKNAYFKYDMGMFKGNVIDTLGLSRFISPSERYHNLTVLMERYNIVWDEDKHHRADYDSEGTALILYKMLRILEEKNINTLQDLMSYPRILIHRK